jgi:hypothetical protein
MVRIEKKEGLERAFLGVMEKVKPVKLSPIAQVCGGPRVDSRARPPVLIIPFSNL